MKRDPIDILTFVPRFDAQIFPIIIICLEIIKDTSRNRIS